MGETFLPATKNMCYIVVSSCDFLFLVHVWAYVFYIDGVSYTLTSNDGGVDDVESEGDGEDADGSDSYSE